MEVVSDEPDEILDPQLLMIIDPTELGARQGEEKREERREGEKEEKKEKREKKREKEKREKKERERREGEKRGEEERKITPYERRDIEIPEHSLPLRVEYINI